MRAVRSSFVVALLALVAAGCATRGNAVSPGGPGDSGNSASDSIAAQPGGNPDSPGVSCATLGFGEPNTGPADTPVPIPAGFTPVAATRCQSGMETVPGDGEWMTRIEQRTEGDFTALMAALRRPNEVAPPNTACTAIGYVPIIVTLIDAGGRTVVPAVPTTKCGAPQPETVQALRDLPWQTQQTTRVRQLQSELEKSSGCSGAYKPTIAVAAALGAQPPVVGPVFPSTPDALRVCRYELTDQDHINGLKSGSLASAGTLDATAAAALVQAMAQAPAAKPCSVVEAPFAVVYPPGQGGLGIAIELGGCYRFLDSNNGSALRQLDAATVAPLLG